MTRLSTLFFACGDGSLEVFFDQAFQILVIACTELTLEVVDVVAVASTFTQADADTPSPNVASTGMNTGNLLGQLVLWHLGNSGCELIIRL